MGASTNNKAQMEMSQQQFEAQMQQMQMQLGQSRKSMKQQQGQFEAQLAATKAQMTAQQAQSAAQLQQANEAANRANPIQATAAGVTGKTQQGARGGAQAGGGTLLTSGLGVDPAALVLGRNTLLGA